jgi:hypothetical protein
MIASRGKFFAGLALMAGFLVVLAVMFMPIFEGMNALDYLDSLYNSISKGSAYYVSELAEEVRGHDGAAVELTLALGDEVHSTGIAALFEAAGAAVERDGSRLRVRGDLGRILSRCVEDSDAMFKNRGEELRDRYGYDEKRALYNWWTALKAMDKELKKQRRFAQADFIVKVQKKAVECAYNYHGIEPQRIGDRIWIVLFSLIFYVVYTVWYGFAIIFLFEGWGLKLSH